MAKKPLEKNELSLGELLVKVAAATPKNVGQLESKLGELTVKQTADVKMAINAIYRFMNPGVGGPG